MPISPPILGAALTLDTLHHHRDWVLERQRDVELQAFFNPNDPGFDWRAGVAKAKTLLAGHTGRLGIHGPFWGFSIDCPDPDLRGVITRKLLHGLDVAEALGATHMVVHSPVTHWDHRHLPLYPGNNAKMVDRVHATLAPVVARAEAIGCALVIENIEDEDPAWRRALAASFGSRFVQVSLDTGHAHLAHVVKAAPRVDEFVDDAGATLAHVHVQDIDGHADRHWHPGEGNIDWPAVFRALSRLPQSPRLIIEVRDIPGLRKGADHLERLGLAV